MKPSATKTSVLPTIVTDTQPLKMAAVAAVDLAAVVDSTTHQTSSPRSLAAHSVAAAVVAVLKTSSVVAADVATLQADSPAAISAMTSR